MSDQVPLRHLVAIPDEVHVGDFVLGLAHGITEKSTITDYVVKEHPGRPLPPVYRDDELIADAKELRQNQGDDAFIAQLPHPEGADAELGHAASVLAESVRFEH